MAETTTVILVVLVLVLLLIIVGLTSVVLMRLRSVAQAPDIAARDAAELRTRLEVLAARNVDFERDMRQDTANARSEQAVAAQTARTELGATLAHNAQTMQQQLATMLSEQNEQWRHFGERLLLLKESNEQRLEAVRATVEQ